MPQNFKLQNFLFYFCISFISGIFLASIIYEWGSGNTLSFWLIGRAQYIVLGFLILGVLIVIISFLFTLKIKLNIAVAGFCILFLALGISRFQITEGDIKKDILKSFNDKPEKVALVGKIIAEPDIRDSFQKLKIRINDTSSTLLVTLGRYPEYHYLDEIKITGTLKTPLVFNDFNYKKYLLKDGIYSVMDFPKTELVSGEHQYNAFSFLYEKVLLLKKKLMKSFEINLSSTHSVILEGIVFGNDKNMPKDLKDKFNATGLSHITAVSGSNIVILISVLMVFLLALGFWRVQAFYFTLALIWFYIILIGFPVSSIRAAIMGSVALLAQNLGRQNLSSRVIILAAAIMLFLNPLLLLYDIGFQLSFLASIGITYLKPTIDYFIGFIIKKKDSNSDKWKIKTLSDIISVTLSAQIFTLPIIAYNFGSISLISPITNILVLPFIPPLTILGFLISIAGIFSNFLAWVFSLPCWFMLMYLLKVLDIFSQPWAVTTFQNISWIWIMVYYIIITFSIWYLKKKQKPELLGY